MSNRTYLFFIGMYILAALYLELDIMIYAVVTLLFIEGILDWNLSWLLYKLRGVEPESGLLLLTKSPKYNFEAMRALRLVLASVVLASYVAVHEYQIEMLWFFPWFLGFAVLGAGVSGVCPVYLAMRWLGFK